MSARDGRLTTSPTDRAGECRVQLFGLARLTAGVKEVTIDVPGPVPIREVIAALAERCPSLVGPVLDSGGHVLMDGFIFNLNGREFLTSLDDALHPGDRLLLLSSAAGG